MNRPTGQQAKALTQGEKDAHAREIDLTYAALRHTADIIPDVLPPTAGVGTMTKGYFPQLGRDAVGVSEACSTAVGHCKTSNAKTTTQGSIALYSTPTLALKALRRSVELKAADQLRKIDRLIEQHADVGN